MVDYEQVLRSARTLLPAIRGGDVRQSMHGGIYVDEEFKSEANAGIQTMHGGDSAPLI